jgi:hypothetical protein
MRINQVQEALWFQQANGDLVAQVEYGLLQRLNLFQEAHPELEPKAVALMSAKLERGALEDAYLLLRGQAHRITGPTEDYWSIIDAAGFFSDATGTRWPYLTQAQRHQYLRWSLEYLLDTAPLSLH